MVASTSGTNDTGEMLSRHVEVVLALGKVLQANEPAGQQDTIQLPVIPLDVDVQFLKSSFATFMADVKGQLSNVAELVVDWSDGQVYPTVIEMHDGSGIPAFHPWPPAAPVVRLREAIKAADGNSGLDAAVLEEMLDIVQDAAAWDAPADIDAIRLVDARFFEDIPGTAPRKDAPLDVERLIAGACLVVLRLAGGMIIEYPAGNKLLLALSSPGTVFDVVAARSVASHLAKLVPPRHFTSCLAGCGAFTVLLVRHGARGKASTLAAPAVRTWIEEPAVSCSLPGEVAGRVGRGKGMKPVLVLKVEPLVHALLDAVNVLNARPVTVSRLDLLQLLVEHAMVFLRSYREQWDARPVPPLMHWVSRMAARLLGIRMDVPRLSVKRVAGAASHAARGILNGASTIVACFLPGKDEHAGVTCLDMTFHDDSFLPRVSATIVPLGELTVDKKRNAQEIARVMYQQRDSKGDAPAVLVVDSIFMARLGSLIGDAFVSPVPSPLLLPRLAALLAGKHHLGLVDGKGNSPSWRKRWSFIPARLVQKIAFDSFRA